MPLGTNGATEGWTTLQRPTSTTSTVGQHVFADGGVIVVCLLPPVVGKAAKPSRGAKHGGASHHITPVPCWLRAEQKSDSN